MRVEGGDRWFEVVRSILDDPTDEGWDDVDTEVREARDDIVRRAVRQGRDDLVRLQSRRTDGWTWGHQHKLNLESQTVGQSDLTPWRHCSTEVRGSCGSSAVVNATGWTADAGSRSTGASMRMVVSLGDLDDSPGSTSPVPAARLPRALHRPDRPLGRGGDPPLGVQPRGGAGGGEASWCWRRSRRTRRSDRRPPQKTVRPLGVTAAVTGRSCGSEGTSSSSSPSCSSAHTGVPTGTRPSARS